MISRRGSEQGARRGGSAGSIAAFLVASLVFAGHLAFGANRPSLALGYAILWFVALAGLLISRGWARKALDAAPLRILGPLFALILVLALLSLTPYGPGGAHPLWSFVSGAHPAVSIDPYATRLEIIKLLALAAAFLIGCLFGAEDERAKALLRALLAFGLAFSAWAFIDHVTSPNLLFGGPRPFGPDRLSGAFGSANTAATLFGALTLLNLTDLVRTYDGVRPSGALHVRHLQTIAPRLARPLLGLALAVTCLILTFSRGGLSATFAVAIVLIGAIALARSKSTGVSAPLIATSIVLVGLVLASVAINIDQLGERFSFVGQDSLIRSQIFAAHWAAFQAAPFGGYGLGSFARINTMIMDAANHEALDTIGAAHNLYIQWLEEAGVFGAAAMFALVGLIAVFLGLGAVRRRRMRAWILGLIAVLALFALHGASDYALQTPSMAVFLSLLLGIGVGISSPGAAPARVASSVSTSSAAAGRYQTSDRLARRLCLESSERFEGRE
jgi:O-antigen ligase